MPITGTVSLALLGFFDSSYRFVWIVITLPSAGASRDGGLQVAAWHFYDGIPEKTAYLKSLIEACHKQSILVYAWLELPQFQGGFWLGSSGVAGESRRPRGCGARLAQAHQPHEPRAFAAVSKVLGSLIRPSTGMG